MTDRLRRLDALFAERVLGKPCSWYGLHWIPLSVSPGPVELTAETFDDWPDLEPYDGIIRETKQRGLLWKRDYPSAWIGHSADYIVPRYTRSLDAAWEGAERINDRQITGPAFAVLEFKVGGREGENGTVKLNARFVSACGRFGSTEKCTADHPAEALVLACLRACGVAESEIDPSPSASDAGG